MSSPGVADDALDILQDALDLLGSLVDWQLSERKWKQVESLVATIAAGTATGDMELLGATLDRPELAGPARVTRIGATPALPAPPPVRDLAYEVMPLLAAAVQQRRRGAFGLK